jgi:hypothetical protein
MSAGSVCRYRYQLEAFIDRLRGRNPEHWHDAQDSVANMEWIEAIYKEVCHIVLLLVFTLTHPFLSSIDGAGVPPAIDGRCFTDIGYLSLTESMVVW